MTLELIVAFDEAIIAELKRIPFHLVIGPSERVLKAMAKPVIIKAKEIAPSSRKSKTRERWGVKYRTDGKYQNDSGQAIGVRYLKNNKGGVLIVGAKHPEANKQNFEAGTKRIVKLWGNDPVKYTPVVKMIEAKDRFMQRAYDETRDAQLSAGHAQLVKEIKELKIG